MQNGLSIAVPDCVPPEESTQAVVDLTGIQSPTIGALTNDFLTRQLVDADSPELLAADEDDEGQRMEPVVAPTPKSQLRGKRGVPLVRFTLMMKMRLVR